MECGLTGFQKSTVKQQQQQQFVGKNRKQGSIKIKVTGLQDRYRESFMYYIFQRRKS